MFYGELDRYKKSCTRGREEVKCDGNIYLVQNYVFKRNKIAF